MTESGLKKMGFVHSWEDRWDLDLKPYVSEKATSDEEYGACWYMDEEYGGYIYIGDDNEMEGLSTKRMLDYLDGLGVPVYDMLMEDVRKRTTKRFKENKAFETLLAKKDNGEKLQSSDFYDIVFEIAKKFGGPSSELNRLINEADFEMIDDYGWELSEEYIRMAIEKGSFDEEEAHTVLLAIWEMDGKNLKKILRELGL